MDTESNLDIDDINKKRISENVFTSQKFILYHTQYVNINNDINNNELYGIMAIHSDARYDPPTQIHTAPKDDSNTLTCNHVTISIFSMIWYYTN